MNYVINYLLLYLFAFYRMAQLFGENEIVMNFKLNILPA